MVSSRPQENAWISAFSWSLYGLSSGANFNHLYGQSVINAGENLNQTIILRDFYVII